MQLKRDTVFALEILLKLADLYINEEENGLLLRDLSLDIGVPRLVADRLCRIMTGAGFIREVNHNEYAADSSTLNVTLFDVINVIEGQTNIFAVFDKNGNFYQRYRYIFEIAEDNFTDELRKLSIGSLMNQELLKVE